MVAASEPARASERGIVLPAVAATAVVVLALGELLFVDGHTLAGLVVDAALVLGLANVAAATSAIEGGRLFGILALAPLARLLVFTMPLGNVPPLYWHALVGAPLLPALALAPRAFGFSYAALGLRRGGLAGQLLIAATGVPLSVAAYEILRPAPIVPHFDRSRLLLGSLTLVVFAAVAEELFFRGLLQQAAAGVFGTAGVAFVNVVFAVTAIGSRSVWYALFAGLMGGWFSFAVDRSRCLWGVIGAHALVAIGLVLVWPWVGLPQI
jgi:membrane protease YdiL (CAAX protease family)